MTQRVIVGIDFSESSRIAHEKGYFWAARLGAELVAMHVLQPPAPMLPEAQIPMPDRNWLESLEAHAKEHLVTMVKNIPDAKTLVKWGSPAEELIGEATKDCLLVVAQVGHSGIERLLFGSTAARVVKHAPCDVLVVRGNK